jgi:argininosuccinate lyase
VKMWSGRFRQPLDPEFERWQRSFPFDRRLLPHELEASRAHARALKKAGILSEEELASILFGLDKIGDQARASAAYLEDEEAEDVHHFVEKQLVMLIGEAGYKLHSGRSRNEQIATDLRLYVRSAIDFSHESLVGLIEALLARVEEVGSAAMPSYTHLQRAEPVLVAHWLLAYVTMLQRDAERLLDCRKRTNLCPLGSGAVAGATIPIDRHALAAELGFDGPTANSLDATSDRDFAIEFVNVLALLGAHMSRWAEEMILFSTQEFGFIELPEAFSTGSSAMPQKKNPDLLELIRGKSARIAGAATSLLVGTKGLPLAYNKDLQETQEPLFEAAETLQALVPLAARWMRAAAFDYENMQDAAQTGFMNAWAAATYLVRQGVPFRMAHEVVGRAVQRCLVTGCELHQLSLEELRGLSPHFGDDFYSQVTLESVLAIHDVPGGTAPERVRHAITEAKQWIAQARGIVHAHA